MHHSSYTVPPLNFTFHRSPLQFSASGEEKHHFFPKKDMMFPCPALAVDFFALEVEEAETLGLGGGGASSSEKDSQTGSSFVTVGYQYPKLL
jgi:hypothetical protein